MSLPQLFVIVCLLRVGRTGAQPANPHNPHKTRPPHPKRKPRAHTHNFGTHATRGWQWEEGPFWGRAGHTRDQRQHQHQRLLVSKGCGFWGVASKGPVFPSHTHMQKEKSIFRQMRVFVCYFFLFLGCHVLMKAPRKKKYIKTKQIAHILGHLMSMMLIGFLN